MARLTDGHGALEVSRGTQVVDRVFDILDAFVAEGPELSVASVSRVVGLKYSTTHRLLEAMAKRGVVYRDDQTKRYRIGPHLRRVALVAIGQMDVFEHAHPFLEELTKATGEASHLAVLDDGWVLYLDKAESTNFPSRRSHVGLRLPAYCTGVGKAMIAFLPGDELNRILARGLTPYTPNTITDPARLRSELLRVRQDGFAVDNEETEEGLICVAAPVRDRSGGVVAAISIGGPASRVGTKGIDAVSAEVTRVADLISGMLGVTMAGNGQSTEESVLP